MRRCLCAYLMLAALTALTAVPAAGGTAQGGPEADYGVCYATLGKGDANAGALITIDLATGAGTIVGSTGIFGGFGDRGVPALAIRSTGEMYALDIGDPAKLYSINAATGAATFAGFTTLSLPAAMGFDGNDQLFAIDGNGDLHKVNHQNGATSFVASTGIAIKGMAFDPQTAALWGCDAAGSTYVIDPKTGATMLVGTAAGNKLPDICFGPDNELIAATGGRTVDNNLIWIDKATGAVDSLIGPIGYRSVSGMAMRHDRLSPVLVQAYNATWLENRVEIVWRLADVTGELSFDITRTADGRVETIRNARVLQRGDNFVFEDFTAEPENTYLYRITIHEDGEAVTSFETAITTPSGRLALEQNVPNPFNPNTSIPFSVDRDTHVSLKVYDSSGRLVATLVDRPMRAGRHSEQWNGRDSAGKAATTGVYFFRLTAGSKTLTRKGVLLK